ncbi:AMP phosphorylase [Candidatus Woesearchaeota archaeon]|nr:AMP phosphorylase [Candidatus Woesearchaeota archaeon]
MKLHAKNIDVSTGGAQIVILDLSDARSMNIFSGDRVKVTFGSKEISAIVEIANADKNIANFKQVSKGKIGLFAEGVEFLKTKNGSNVEISLENKPKSIEIIRKKLEGKKLNYEDIDTLVKEIVTRKLSDVELTYFVSGSYINGLDMTEAVYLTKAIVNNDAKLTFPKGKIIMDKHCIGGVPGNRTTMIVVPIIASLGLYIPKTSSRSITSPAGTSDTVEVLANVSLDANKIKKVVEKTNGCLVWGGGVNLASADDKLIKVRHPLSLDPRGMLLASIMAKKHSVSATHVLIDIPVGKGAKIEDMKVAKELKGQFETISKRLGMKCKVAITDGSQPIGKGIGPALEARDVLYTLMNDPKGSPDLKEKGITLATEMYLLSGLIKDKKKARKQITELYDSGIVLQKFKEILKAQGGKILDPEKIPLGSYKKDFVATESGTIHSIDNKKISLIARLAGAPSDKQAGMQLYCKVGQKINKGEVLFTLYSNSKIKGEFAYSCAMNDSPFRF